MPITATLAMLAAASMAGLPPLNGFLSKEMMLEEAAHTVYRRPGLAGSGAGDARRICCRRPIRPGSLSACFSAAKRNDYPQHPHDPPFGMWLPVAVLVVPVVAIGLMPATLAGPIVERTALAAVGGALPAIIWRCGTA